VSATAQLARTRMLGRMAGRYARRHRGQTARAIAGLVVVALVLTVGFGLGDSVGGSLERNVRAQFGPVDVVMRAPTPFPSEVASGLPDAPDVARHGVTGGGTLIVVGAAFNPTRDRAEAFAALRGVHPAEPAALGPLPGGVAEPRPGETVLSQSLAKRLEARPGDLVVFRAPLPSLNFTVDLDTTNVTGLAAPPQATGVQPFEVREGALGLAAVVQWEVAAGEVRATVVAPSGATFANASGTSPLRLLVEGPLEPGTWTLRVDAEVPRPYAATILVAYPPPLLESGIAVLQARVAAVAPNEGRAANHLRPVALVPLGDLQAALQVPGQVTHGFYAVDGDPYAVVDAMRDALGNETYEVRAVQAEAVERARSQGANVTGFLLVMGGFTIVASALLAYALFSALVEERRVELGIARALGVTRGEVTFTMVVEGLYYAVLASLVGVLLGAGLVAIFVRMLHEISTSRDGPTFLLHLEPGALAAAFLGGVLVPLATIAAGSLRFARLDPARAIRGAPDDVRVNRRALQAVAMSLLLIGVVLSLLGVGRLVGVPMAAAGAAILLAVHRRLPWAFLLLAPAVAYTVWTLYEFRNFPSNRRDLDPILTMARGLVLALILCGLAVASPRPFRWMGSAFGRLRRLGRPAYLAFRYLGARRRAAGLTAAMIAVVAVVVNVTGALALTFAATIPDHEGGFEVVGQSPLPHEGFPTALPGDLAPEVADAHFLVVHMPLRPPQASMDGNLLTRPWMFRYLVGADAEFAQAQRFELAERAPQYATDAAAWDAVVRGEAILAPPWYFDPDELTSGGTLQLDPVLGPSREYVVAGAVRGMRNSWVFLADAHVRDLGFPHGALTYVRLTPGADPDAVAHRLTAAYGPEGLVFESVPEEARRAAAATQATVLVFESFLALGLFVGVSATGFLAARAVHERMRDLGTLRALGYEAPDVRRAFVVESVVVATVGLVVGTAVGLLVAHAIWWREVRLEGTGFQAPWFVTLGFAAAVLLLAAVAAWRPARRAAALEPAVAVRYTE
jgi:putative ABC transport system permease protein